MFWDRIDCSLDEEMVSILDNEDLDKITLEELIDKIPNLGTEYDLSNEKVITILKRKDIVESLIRNITELPPDHLDEEERFKYANTSCILFTSKSKEMENQIVDDEQLLDRLLEFLNTDQQLNPLMASFFANALYSIYTKFTEQMISYFNKKANFFDLIFKHLNSSAIIDFLLKLITLENVDCKFFLPVYEWLNSQNIIKQTVNVFRTQTDSNALENASNFIIHLIQRGRQPVIHVEEEKKFYQFITSEQILVELVEILGQHKRSAIHILRILIQVADYENYFRIVTEIKKTFVKIDCEPNTPSDVLSSIHDSTLASASYEYLTSVKNLHKIILKNLDHFKQLLVDSVPDYTVNTSFGLIEKPLGFLRLEVVHLFYALLNANNPEMNEAIAKANVLEIIINLFFEYEFNSFLHNHVNNIVVTIFLNANENRFKLLTNDEKREEFLKLEQDVLKEKSFIELANYAWSDKDCYQKVKKLVDDIKKTSPEIVEKLQQEIKDLFKIKPTYTPLISQIFNECNLVVRIMSTYSSIMNRVPMPALKSNLIDMGEAINKYLSEYKSEEILKEDLKTKWNEFTVTELEKVEKKIREVEKTLQNQKKADQNFQDFKKQPKISGLLNSPLYVFNYIYNPKDYEFSMDSFETQFDKEVKDLPAPELRKASNIILHKSVGYEDKNFISIDSQEFDEQMPTTSQPFGDESETDCLNIESSAKDNEQISCGSLLSCNDFKDNLFYPLASSSNISNELNIEMDINISKDDTESSESTMKDTIAEQKSSEGQLMEQKPIEDQQMECKPIEDQLMEDKSMDYKSMDYKSMDDKSMDDKPMDDKPMDDKPFEDQSIEDKSIEDKEAEKS